MRSNRSWNCCSMSAGIMHKLSTAVPQSSVLTALCFLGLPSASFHRYGGVRGERDGVEFAKRRRRDVCEHRGGGGTKKSMPSRRHPSGGWGLRTISVSLVVTDVPASPSPCSLISPRKPHQRTSPYLSSEALNVLQEYACGARPASGCPRTPCHRGAYGTSSRKPMHTPGLP